MDPDGRLMYMNSAACRMLGWTESELHGEYMQQMVDFRTADGTAVAPGVPQRSGRGVFTRKDGSTFPVAFSTVALRTGVKLNVHSKLEAVAVTSHEGLRQDGQPN